MATPSVLTFDAKGRAVDFEVWVDDLQLFLQCDRADGLSLFDLTCGASSAPATDADATVCSQWATRDAAARLAGKEGKGAGGAGEGWEAAVEAAEGVGLAVGVVAGVGAPVAAEEAEEAAVVAVRAEVAEVEAMVEVAAAEVELVEAALCRGSAPVVVSASSSSSSALVGPLPPSSFVSGTLLVSGVGVLAPVPTFYVPATAWIFDLDYDAILAAMYAVTISHEVDCYRCFPPDPGIGAAALGAGEAAALGAKEPAAQSAGESALSGTASAPATHTFTLDSSASCSFFRDRTTLTLIRRPVAVSLADPSWGPVLAHFSTVLLCPAAPSGTLLGLYLPSFSTT
ncbi:unnamed protein product, partial [Closterium sp. NIES-64]